MPTPLFVTSSYSFHFGVVPPAALAAAAKRLGYDALALTDRNAVYGIPTFIEACRDAGIRPVLGTELVYEGGRALLLAKDKRGFARLSRLLTERAELGLDAREALLGDHGGLVVLSDDPALLDRGGADEELYALLSPCNRPLWRRLRQGGRPCVAAGEARFLDREDRAVQRLLVAIGSGRTVPEVRDGELSPEAAFLRSPEDFAATYAEAPEALRNNEELAGKLALSDLFDGFVFPSYPTEAGESAAARLRALVLEGAARRYGSVEGAVGERIGYELGIIEGKGFSDYFLVVRDIVQAASRSCGRGSAAASIVSYALGITDVDPLRHALYFERFLNPGRVDPPDIDVDFAWDERDALLASVIAGYGESRAARVANHVCFQTRSALRETARAYGMPDGEISAFEKRLRIDEAGAKDGADGTWAEIARLASRIVGLPRHLGVHSGGLIVVPDSLASHVPLERTGTGIRVTVWDKEGVEAAGLVKIDLLGNRSLAVVRDALANLAENGIELREDSWRPIDDAPTVELLARGDSMGVFYVESPAMRLLQRKTGRGDFEHLVIHSSMIRPAANRYINEYIDRLGGKPYTDLHPLLAGLLDESMGIMCYQEDVCKAAIALAGFTAAEADGIRKCLSKKDAHARLATYKAKFDKGARENGVDEGTTGKVWEMIESFSGYSFVKAHSASYAMLSFRSAYLRRHHPAEFMAAVISNRGGYYSTLAYASESRRMGLTILPPDANESEIRCRGKGTGIRFGLGMIASLNETAAKIIVGERGKNGPYRSIDSFARRVRIERSDAEALAGAGALDSLSPELSRAEKLMRLLSAQAAREGPAHYDAELFPETAPAFARKPAARDGERRRLESEMRYLGTTLAVHPLALWPEALSMRRSLGKDLDSLVGKRVDLVGWPVASKLVATASEEPMEFVSFEDETALYETVLFPEAYGRFRHLLFETRPLLLHGRVERDRGAVTVTLSGLEKIP